jgi:hypothetical protein
MHMFDELAHPQGRERDPARPVAATASMTPPGVPAAALLATPSLREASSLECARLLQRFVLDPVETARDARVDSAELMRLYRAGVDRRIAEAGVSRHGAPHRPLATLGPDVPTLADVPWDLGPSSRPLQMGIAALSAAVTVTSIVSAALSAISSLLRHKPV